jgi:hypothetical protein
MKAVAGLTAVVVIAVGSLLAAGSPGATTPRMQTLELMEPQSEEVPSYIQVDPDDWR